MVAGTARIGKPAGALVSVAAFMAAGIDPASAQERKTAIFTMAADGSDVRKLAKVPDYDWHGSPAWSRDGKRIAFDAAPGGPRTGQAHIFVVDADGKNLKDLGVGSVPRWAPDDKQLLFFYHERSNAGAEPGAYVMNADGTGRQRLSDGERARWSPDGSRLVLTIRDEQAVGLFVYDVIAESRWRIAGPGYQKIIGGAWSPDGRRIAFIGFKDDSTELCIVPADAEDPKPQVRFRGAKPYRPGSLGWQPDWSPDGDSIVLWVRDKDGHSRIHVIDVEGDGPPRLLENQLGASNYNTDAVWSPDGKRIAFASDRPE